MTGGPKVTRTAARAADFPCHKLAPSCFPVYKALTPSLAHVLPTTLCVWQSSDMTSEGR